MHYRGDGSYKPQDYEFDTSLLTLLTLEQEQVDKLNTYITAYDKAKRMGMRLNEHIKNIDSANKQLEETRDKIRIYLKEQINK